MYLGFGRRLRTLGGVRLFAGVRLKGATAAFLFFFIAIIRLYWYIMLGMLWMIYGFGYLCFYLPVRGIVSLCKKRKKQ